MAAIVTNNAKGTLTAGISSSATSITLQTGEGALFPTTSASDFFYVTLVATSGSSEIVKCTSRSGDVLTIVRLTSGHDDYSDNIEFVQDDKVELRLTASTLNEKLDTSGGAMTGDLSLADAVKATFGAGNDLQIYHTGSQSIISDTGTGSLFLQGTDLALKDSSGFNFITCTDTG